MTKLKDKIQDALDESRMLVLGAEILVGFEFTATFQDGFSKLSIVNQCANTAALMLMIVVLILLIAPCAFHQIVAHGEDRLAMQQFATRMMDAALLPFAIGIGLTVYIPIGVVAGILATVLALSFWYGPGLVCGPKETSPMTEEPTQLHDKIRQALTEARVIIPGNQALLGFQFAVILQKAFAELPQWVRWFHMGSLCFITVSTILLMTPAAFHRIVEHGESTERFFKVTERMVLWSLPPLALGVCGDLFVVLFRISGDVRLSFGIAGAMLLVFFGMWFAYPVIRHTRFPDGELATQPR